MFAFLSLCMSAWVLCAYIRVYVCVFVCVRDWVSPVFVLPCCGWLGCECRLCLLLFWSLCVPCRDRMEDREKERERESYLAEWRGVEATSMPSVPSRPSACCLQLTPHLVHTSVTRGKRTPCIFHHSILSLHITISHWFLAYLRPSKHHRFHQSSSSASFSLTLLPFVSKLSFGFDFQ